MYHINRDLDGNNGPRVGGETSQTSRDLLAHRLNADNEATGWTIRTTGGVLTATASDTSHQNQQRTQGPGSLSGMQSWYRDNGMLATLRESTAVTGGRPSQNTGSGNEANINSLSNSTAHPKLSHTRFDISETVQIHRQGDRATPLTSEFNNLLLSDDVNNRAPRLDSLHTGLSPHHSSRKRNSARSDNISACDSSPLSVSSSSDDAAAIETSLQSPSPSAPRSKQPTKMHSRSATSTPKLRLIEQEQASTHLDPSQRRELLFNCLSLVLQDYLTVCGQLEGILQWPVLVETLDSETNPAAGNTGNGRLTRQHLKQRQVSLKERALATVAELEEMTRNDLGQDALFQGDGEFASKMDEFIAAVAEVLEPRDRHSVSEV